MAIPEKEMYEIYIAGAVLREKELRTALAAYEKEIGQLRFIRDICFSLTKEQLEAAALSGQTMAEYATQLFKLRQEIK